VARGFGTVWGTGALDRLETSFSAHSTALSVSFWLYFEASGRYVVNKGLDCRIGYTGGNAYFYQRNTWTSGARSFNIPRGTINVWEHYLVVDENDSPTKGILVYRDGVRVTASQFDTPDAPYAAQTGNLNIGNRSGTSAGGSDAWQGALGPLAVWSTAPSTAVAENMAMALSQGAPPYRVYAVDQLQIWQELDTGDAAEPIRGGQQAPTGTVSAFGAPVVTGDIGGPGTKAYLPWQFGSFLGAAASTSELTAVSDEQGHTVAAPTQTQSHVLVNVAATQGHTATAPFLIESIAGVPSTMGHTVAAPTLTRPLVVVNASIGNVFKALRLTQTHSLSPQSADQVSTASVAGLGGIPLSMGVANAETLPEVADYNIGDKPIGQWTVGTDYVAATANTAGYVALQQNLLNFRLANGFWGFTTTAPDFNQTASTVGVANAEQGETADPVDFTQVHTLVAVSADAGFTVAAPAITQPSAELGVVVPNTMGIEVAAPDLTILGQSLGVAASEVGYTVAAPNLFLIPNTPTPAIRIFTPAAEDRTLTVRTEDRSFAIAA
jgi:hypothetical protein